MILINLLVYYGARRRRWMPFWPPFLWAGEQCYENTSRHKIKSIIQLNCRFIYNKVTAPSIDPCERGILHRIGLINRSHMIGGANSTQW
jgi:hypothetical protein